MADKTVAVLDFGSSKLSVLVGERIINNNFRIFASGNSDFAGFMDGEFLEPENLEESVKNAINNAQINLNKKINKVYIGVPAEFCFVAQKELLINFKAPTKIKQKHIDKLFYEDLDAFDKLSSTHTVINKSPIFYVLDETNNVLSPIGIRAMSLMSRTSFVYVLNTFVESLKSIMLHLGIKEYEFICSTLAESVYLLDNEIRSNGAILVDCGYITTSISSIVGDGLIDLKSFSLGGGHITGDLSEILHLPFLQAESLKRKLILTVQPTALDYYEVNIKNKIVKVGAKTANDIALARIDMIADMIIKVLNKMNFRIEENMPIYLTGGGLAYLKGIKDYLNRVINRKIIIVSPQPLQYHKPDMASEISLLDTALNLEN